MNHSVGLNIWDEDSDDDGLVDGYVEGLVWHHGQGVFVPYDTAGIELPPNTPGPDPWEGEDRDGDGAIGS